MAWCSVRWVCNNLPKTIVRHQVKYVIWKIVAPQRIRGGLNWVMNNPNVGIQYTQTPYFTVQIPTPCLTLDGRAICSRPK